MVELPEKLRKLPENLILCFLKLLGTLKIISEIFLGEFKNYFGGQGERKKSTKCESMFSENFLGV